MSIHSTSFSNASIRSRPSSNEGALDAADRSLPGDGIGPEVIAAARVVLQRVAEQRGEQLAIEEHPIGGAAIDACGEALPAETLSACVAADAVLLGAVGGPKWGDPNARVRPEDGLLALRRELGLFANLRPVRGLESLVDCSPLRPEIAAGVDLLFVRELTGGIYFGAKERTHDRASDTCSYSAEEIARVVRVAAELARARRGRLTSVDKANVLESSRLWREVTTRVLGDEFADVELEHVLVDAMAMHLIQRASSFDVIVTENMFGDILTDEASVLVGSLGMLPSASMGGGTHGLFEPIHGSAPDLVGRDLANPCAAIASTAMLVRQSLGWQQEAALIDQAIQAALESGVRTHDLGGQASGSEMLAAIIKALDAQPLIQQQTERST